MRVILLGGSKTVYFLARQFVHRKYHVTVIDREHARCRKIAQQIGVTVVRGDGTEVQRLEEAGARLTDVLLALTLHDQDNLIACQIAQRMFGVPRTIALVNDPDNEAIFKQLGVTMVFSTTRVITSMLDHETDFSEIASLMPVEREHATL
jgi:trk system potassium uptake protein